jgi:GTPase SAR1 family protein
MPINVANRRRHGVLMQLLRDSKLKPPEAKAVFRQIEELELNADSFAPLEAKTTRELQSIGLTFEQASALFTSVHSVVRLVVLGKTGAGKSWLCNTLMGEETCFWREGDDGPDTVTTELQIEEHKAWYLQCNLSSEDRPRSNQRLSIVDTPALDSTSHQNLFKTRNDDNLVSCLSFGCFKNCHAFIIVVNFEEGAAGMDPATKAQLDSVARMFRHNDGAAAAITEFLRRSIVVITRWPKECSDENGVERTTMREKVHAWLAQDVTCVFFAARYPIVLPAVSYYSTVKIIKSSFAVCTDSLFRCCAAAELLLLLLLLLLQLLLAHAMWRILTPVRLCRGSA